MSMNSVCNTRLEPHADHLDRPAWLERLSTWRDAWLNRRRLARLLSYDDHLLADMGYRRIDLTDAMAVPTRAEAEALLQQRKEERRRTG
ncbi:hypothetical protein [Saccharospirillum mangrovi]|uniref:hypothetical protein n=1 Tax=Saccharospirillum mangrovi TaxID=2161747 RepID=UPI000D34587A|nr:hypothetical protein [Saccharospirillum mangrovi]